MSAIRGIVGTLGELFQFMWKCRLYWLIPMILVLLLFSMLIIMGSAGGIGPFIYTLF